jgi:ABC-type dipeptide/oligopeptide/nickel transport system ATPase component
MDSANKHLSDAEQYIGRNLNYIQGSIQNIFPQDIASGGNGNLIQNAMSEIQLCGKNVDGLLNQALTQIRQCRDKLSEHAERIDLLHKQQEMQFRALIEKHKESQSKATERIKLEKRRNELLRIKNELNEIEDKGKNLKKERNTILSRLSELRDKKFHVRQEIVNHINKNLEPSIRVSIEQYGNLTEYCNFLAECLKNPRMQYRKVAEKIANAFWPSDISTIIREKNLEKLMVDADLNENQAKYSLESLEKPEMLHRLELVELIDLPQIELNDHATYKTTASLSTGQKCNSILPILLLDSDSPLLIDQPEDNLDNGFVHNTIVESVCKVKTNRQMIFVTHNPNIPVLGDAERIFVLESNGTSASKKNSGGVDTCKKEIVSLLEGGEDAFKKRKVRYSY